MKEKKNPSKPLTRIFKDFIAPHKFWLFIRVLGAIAGAAVDIVLAYIIVQVVDTAIAGDQESLRHAFIVMLGAVATGVASSLLNRYSSGRLGAMAVKSIRSAAGSHTPELKVSYMDTRNSGQEISKLTNAMTNIQNFIENDLPNMIFQPLRFLGAFVYMLFINWKMLLLCVFLMPVMLFIANVVTQPIEKLAKNLQDKAAAANSVVQDSMGGMQILRAYNLKNILFKKYEQAIKDMTADALGIEKRRSFLTPVRILLQLIPFSLCFAYGGYLSIQGQLTTGGLVAFIQLMNYIVMPAVFIPGVIANSKNTAGTASHIFELLDAETERKSGLAESRNNVKAAVAFSNVSFGYNSEADTIRNISFTLPENSMTALVGHSGGGKSTLLKLIQGFYCPVDGRIEILGTDVNEWDLKKMRGNIAVVSQDSYLFPVSIADNIAYGRPDASREEVIEAAKAASAHEFIIQLPQGYETVVGERGTGLSGGQRQRISIARALISQCPILLFDEPSSALDNETESDIQKELKKLSENHTLLVSAHRLSITKDADNIIVLDKGEISEIATHEVLMEHNAVYRELVLKQDNPNLNGAVLEVGA